jgi:ankyrin repeat protein
MVTNTALFCYENGVPETPLHVACSIRNLAGFSESELEIVCFLLQKGARIHAQKLDIFSTPLHEETRDGKAEIVKVLLENGADNTWAEGVTPPLQTALEVVIQTVQLGSVEVFRERGGANAEVS